MNGATNQPTRRLVLLLVLVLDAGCWQVTVTPAGHVPYIMKLVLTAIVEPDAHGVFACCHELKGCHTQGRTVTEAKLNLIEAVELYLETLSPDEISALVGTVVS